MDKERHRKLDTIEHHRSRGQSLLISADHARLEGAGYRRISELLLQAGDHYKVAADLQDELRKECL